MPNFSDYLLRPIHWILRFRHRKGYGIHSPFAFNFVTGVIYELGEYYAYRSLDQVRKTIHHRYLRRKDYRLLMRLANFQRPQTCLLYATEQDSLILTYLQAGSCHTHYRAGGSLLTAPAPSANMVVASGNWELQAENLLNQLQPGGMLVLIGLKNKMQRQAWKQLLQAPQAQVSFDLRDFGLVFFRPELQREHYVINYL